VKQVKRLMVVVAVVVGSLGVVSPALAQVGYEPQASPYRDVEYRQGVTAFAGWYSAALDPGRVASRSGPMAGLRYDLTLAGPAQLTVRSAYVHSERNVIDPRQPRSRQLLPGRRSAPLLLNDVGISLNLTGARSWHNLIPLIQFGGGTATDLHSTADIGNYSFGTTFALSVGTGIRWVSGGRWEVRGDVTDHLYSIRYPSTYAKSYTTDPNDAVLGLSGSRSLWRHNAGLTIGLTYKFLR
jgi:hypothetical protein